MNPALMAAIAGTLARALMQWASGYGVTIGSEEANQIANALLLIVPVIWGIVHKVKVDAKIKEAKAGV